jgi:hypothetical protein
MPASTVRPLDRTARGLFEQPEDLEAAREPGNDDARSHQSDSESPPAAVAKGTGPEERRSTDDAWVRWAA